MVFRFTYTCGITNSGDQVKKTEMGRTCGTYGKEERCIQGVSGGNLREGVHLEDPGVDNIKMDLREVGWGAWTESIWFR
jgi:hypothetical protein